MEGAIASFAAKASQLGAGWQSVDARRPPAIRRQPPARCPPTRPPHRPPAACQVEG